MSNVAYVGLDLDDPVERDLFDQWSAHHKAAPAVPGVDLIKHLKETKTGKTFLWPLAQVIVPGQWYTRAELAQLVPALNEKQVFSRIRVLGRPESRFKARVFDRSDNGKYRLTQPIRDAILAA